MSSGPFLYPNVTSIPGQTGVQGGERPSRKSDARADEFNRIFDQAVDEGTSKTDLNQIKAPLKFSAHASERLRDRKIHLDPQIMAKVNEAIDQAESKGVDDTLVLTKDAALIVNVKNRTVITALDRNAATGNVFTNIDGAVLV